jgi:hypothetical protein
MIVVSQNRVIADALCDFDFRDVARTEKGHFCPQIYFLQLLDLLSNLACRKVPERVPSRA